MSGLIRTKLSGLIVPPVLSRGGFGMGHPRDPGPGDDFRKNPDPGDFWKNPENPEDPGDRD